MSFKQTQELWLPYNFPRPNSPPSECCHILVHGKIIPDWYADNNLGGPLVDPNWSSGLTLSRSTSAMLRSSSSAVIVVRMQQKRCAPAHASAATSPACGAHQR